MIAVQPEGLLPDRRRALLLEALNRHGTVRVTGLADSLGVTPITIRRDINQLAAEGLVRRVHGGATLPAGAGTAGTELTSTPVRLPGTGGAVGMIVPSLDYYWPEVVRGAEEEARSRGLRTILRGSSYGSDDDQAQIAHLLQQASVGGLILAPNMNSPRAPEMLEWLSAQGVPAVLVEREASLPPHHQQMESVVSDHASGAMAAVRHLVELGHRKIGLVVSEYSPTSPHVRRGWIQATRECQLGTSGVVDRQLDQRQSIGYHATVESIVEEALETGTTALLVHADSEAITIVQHCQNRGLNVPGDLSIVAYDDEVAGLFSPALTAVRPPRNSIGRAAMSLMASRLNDPDRPAHRIVITPGLQIRASTSAPKRRA